MPPSLYTLLYVFLLQYVHNYIILAALVGLPSPTNHWMEWIELHISFSTALLTGCPLDPKFHSQRPVLEGSSDKWGSLQLHWTGGGQPKWLLWAMWFVAKLSPTNVGLQGVHGEKGFSTVCGHHHACILLTQTGPGQHSRRALQARLSSVAWCCPCNSFTLGTALN